MTNSLQGRKLFSLWESYRIYYAAMRTVPYMIRGEKRGLLSLTLREQLMMAVTQVNGCAMCSYYHVRVALDAGMDSDAVNRLLDGEYADVPQDEMTAVLFAQHCADTRGHPDAAAWKTLQTQYGRDAALAILGAIRGIMLGNALGIPAGSLLSRLGVKRFKADSRSSVFYEIALLLGSVVLLPVAALHALVARVLSVPVTP